MAIEIPYDEPTRLRAGDTLSWRKTLDEFPATDGWVLHYRLINASAKIDLTASASGADHLISVAASTSAAYVSGNYTWTSWVTQAAERYTVSTGLILIEPDLAAVSAAGYDTRSNAKKTLDLLDAALLAHGGNAWTQEYEVAGRRMKFRSPGEFIALRSQIQAEVQREDNAARLARGERPRNTIQVRL